MKITKIVALLLALMMTFCCFAGCSEEPEEESYYTYTSTSETTEEVEDLVKVAITEVGATSMKEMGLVIKNVSAKANGRTDGKTISMIVKRLLS